MFSFIRQPIVPNLPPKHGLQFLRKKKPSCKRQLPVVMETDRAAIEAALSMQNLAPPEQVRVARIKNTLALGPIQLSGSRY